MDLSFFKTQQENGVLTVLLNRPPVNAFNRECLLELDELVGHIRSQNDLRVVILTAHGKVFSAGADLKERRSMSDEEVLEFVESIRASFYSWYDLDIPTICAMQGGAFGGGLELALMCDFRILAKDAEVGLKETRLGVIPGAGGTQRLTRLIGEAGALKWILTGKTFTASEALDAGVVDVISDPDQVVSTAGSLAGEIVKAAPVAVKQAKRAVRDGAKLDYKEALDLEGECYKQTIPTTDREEALKAFLEKRAPNWTGK